MGKKYGKTSEAVFAQLLERGELEVTIFPFYAATRYFQLQQAQFIDQPNLGYNPNHDWFMSQFRAAKKDCLDQRWVEFHECLMDRGVSVSKEKCSMMAFELDLWDKLWKEIPEL